MKQLINITEQNGKKAVSARELHQFLENKERFSKWFERMVSYGFENQIDYTPYQMVHPHNNQEITDYALTVDTAKEISMIQKSEKGRQARRYFIECEKQARQMPAVAPADDDKAYLELTRLVKKHLCRGDVKDVARQTGLGEKTLGLVSKGMKAKPEFIQALYERALENKKSGKVIDVQKMINTLNQL